MKNDAKNQARNDSLNIKVEMASHTYDEMIALQNSYNS